MSREMVLLTMSDRSSFPHLNERNNITVNLDTYEYNYCSNVHYEPIQCMIFPIFVLFRYLEVRAASAKVGATTINKPLTRKGIEEKKPFYEKNIIVSLKDS